MRLNISAAPTTWSRLGASREATAKFSSTSPNRLQASRSST